MNVFALGSAFLMGVFGGVHCIAMCGGVVGVLCAGLPAGGRAKGRMGFVLSYNAGRITTYSCLGLVAGGLGAASASAFPMRGAQIVLRLSAALIMVGAGLYLADVYRGFARIETAGRPLWRLVEPHARRLGPVRSRPRAMMLGALWGFLPCGLVYAALSMALVSGSVAHGGATMLAFGLGTLPTLIAMGGFAELVRELSRHRVIRKTAGLFIALAGSVHLVMAGMTAGWVPTSFAGSKAPCCVDSKAAH